MAMAAMDSSVPEKEKQQGKVSTDFVFDNIGQFGKWQFEILFIICLSKFPVGWHQLATVFLAPPVSYSCADPGNTTDACSPDCKRVEYDRSVFKNTVIMEWDLICDKSTWADTGQSVFMFGVLTGNVIFGIWADKKGRRPPLLFSVVLQLVAGVAASMAPSYWMFVVCRYFLAVAIGGNMLTTFCVLMEIIGPKHRELINGVIFQIPFNFGHLLLAPVAYFIRDFRTLQFVLSSFSVLLLSFFWICPESPRWLLNAGRVDESIEILKNAAKKNKLPTDNISGDVISARAVVEAQPTQSKGNVTDLLKTPNLRKKTLCIFFNWLAIGFNFFGVSTYIGKLSGNIFMNVAVSASFSIPGLMMAAPSCKYLGRTRAIALAHAVCILGMGTFIVMPPHLGTVRLILASLAVFGGMWAFASIYIVAAEVFPTVGRNAGIGVCSMLARIGAMLTPYAAGLSKHAEWVPPAFFCVSSFLAIICILMVPETKGAPLPETLEDAENFGKKRK